MSRASIGRTALACLGLVVAGSAAGDNAQAKAPSSIIPIDEIRPGMKGHAMTVVHGQKPERFEIEVVDVVRDYLPRQDAVLFRSNDPEMLHTGIAGGMSGSPIYIEGRLAGALAYGYPFNKDPIGGMTPIENMLEVDRMPWRPELFETQRAKTRAEGRQGKAAWADAILGLQASPLPPRLRPQQAVEDPSRGLIAAGSLEHLAIPMNVAGFGPKAAAFLGDTLGVVPTRGGGSGASASSGGKNPDWAFAGEDYEFEPGSSVSVVLISGDNAAAPNGTVTWIGGKNKERMLAFGHPMYGDGPARLPIADARVHVVIPSRQRSIKLSSPGTIRGTMVQDRQPAIALRRDIEAPTIPVRTVIHAPENGFGTRSYESQVAVDRSLTPALVASLLLDGVDEAAADGTQLGLELRHKIKFQTSQGPRTVEMVAETYHGGGIGRSPARTPAIGLVATLVDNEWELAEVLSVEQEARVHYDPKVEEISEIRHAQDTVRAGQALELDLVLLPPRGPELHRKVSVRIPEDAAGEDIVIELGGGPSVRPYMPRPDSLDELVDNLSRQHPRRSMVLSIYREAEGLSTRQGLIEELPDSTLELLSPASGTRAAVRVKRAARRVIRTDAMIYGSARLKLHVEAARGIRTNSGDR